MSAADRIRREGPSVHHALCSLRRPPTAWAECTCRVPQVATALADLLGEIDGAGTDEHRLNEIRAARDALEAAIDRSGT